MARPKLKLVEEILTNYHLHVGSLGRADNFKPVITEIHIGTTTNVRDKKTGGLVTSRSSAEIMNTEDAEKIARKLGIQYIEPYAYYRVALDSKLKVKSMFLHKLRKGRELTGNKLKRRAKWMGLKTGVK